MSDPIIRLCKPSTQERESICLFLQRADEQDAIEFEVALSEFEANYIDSE